MTVGNLRELDREALILTMAEALKLAAQTDARDVATLSCRAT